MWFGKIGVILFIFSFASLWSAYYLNQVFNDACITSSDTFQAMNTLITGTYANATSASPGFNTNLVFGDFLSTYTILKALFTGTTFANVFVPQGSTNSVLSCSGFGGFDYSFTLLMTGMFDLSVVFFLLYIISFRSI